MEIESLLCLAGQRLSGGSRTRLRGLLEGENSRRLANRLIELRDRGVPTELPPPRLDAETTPAMATQFERFDAICRRAGQAGDGDAESLIDEMAEILRTGSIGRLLGLLGQRRTPGSVNDHRGFPPPRSRLIDAADQPVGNQSTLSRAARALQKHAIESTDDAAIWPPVVGDTDNKNVLARGVVDDLLDRATWWNIFEHFQHGLIHEVRVPTGHGARWAIDGPTFIGFVDPFAADHRMDSAEGRSDDGGKQVGDDSDPTDGNDVNADAPPLPNSLTREQLQQHLDAGRRSFPHVDFSGVDLSHMDLSGLDLGGGDFRRAKLFDVNLSGATLTESNFSKLFLKNTDFTGAQLRRADFSGVRADGVRWRNLDLTSARLQRARMAGATFEGCVMKATNFVGTDLTETTWDHCRCYGANFENATLAGAYLYSCRMQNARLVGVDAAQVRMDHCSLKSTSFAAANLTRAHLWRCEMTEADFSGTDLANADLYRSVLDRARLPGARLPAASLQEVSCVRADLSRTNLAGANLRAAKLEQADLSRSDLRGANLAAANLQGADISAADVVDTRVDDATEFEAAKTVGVDFGTNWMFRQRVVDSTHRLTIRHFRRKHPVLGFVWWALLGCGQHPGRLLAWGVALVLLYAGIMAAFPGSFDFGQPSPTAIDHLRNSLAVFVTLDLAVDKGSDAFGRTVMLSEMLCSYLMLGFMASLFSGIFPTPPE